MLRILDTGFCTRAVGDVRPGPRLMAVLGFVLALVLLLSQEAEARRYAAMVVDAETGRVLRSANPDRQVYPASLTKMMTLYMVFDALERGRLSLDQKLTVSRRAAGMPPSRIGLRRGSKIRVEDAILALVTKSANDIAVVIAEALGGTESQFARIMTKKARALGMTRTTFRNASGLPNRHQLTTARDMARLARRLLYDFPKQYRYFNTRRFRYAGRTYRNHNRMLASYRGTDGIKTGYIHASGFNIAVSTVRNGRRLIAVVFGGRTARSRDRHAAKLLNEVFTSLPLLAELRPPGPPQRKPYRLEMVVALAGAAHDEMDVLPAPARTSPGVAWAHAGTNGVDQPAGGPWRLAAEFAVRPSRGRTVLAGFEPSDGPSGGGVDLSGNGVRIAIFEPQAGPIGMPGRESGVEPSASGMLALAWADPDTVVAADVRQLSPVSAPPTSWALSDGIQVARAQATNSGPSRRPMASDELSRLPVLAFTASRVTAHAARAPADLPVIADEGGEDAARPDATDAYTVVAWSGDAAIRRPEPAQGSVDASGGRLTWPNARPAGAPGVPGSLDTTEAFGIQVGAFINPGSARSAALAVLRQLPEVLGGTETSVAPHGAHGGTLYRSRLMGLTEPQARAACAALHQRKQACHVVLPTG